MELNIRNKIRNLFETHFNRDINLISYIEAKDILKENPRAVLIDVRSIGEYNEYHLNGAICIPNFELEEKIVNIIDDKSQIIILYCQTGRRSRKAANLLKKLGYKNVFEVEGGIDNI